MWKWCEVRSYRPICAHAAWLGEVVGEERRESIRASGRQQAWQSPEKVMEAIGAGVYGCVACLCRGQGAREVDYLRAPTSASFDGDADQLSSAGTDRLRVGVFFARGCDVDVSGERPAFPSGGQGGANSNIDEAVCRRKTVNPRGGPLRGARR